GEPTCRRDEARTIALYIKERWPSLPIRINTNGHSDLIIGKNSAPLYEGAFDSVSISLNTPSAEKYNALCHPVYHEEAFNALLTFAENVKNYVQKVCFSVVRETLTDEELLECERLAERAGVTLKVRTYIGK
ncbi:MAG: radical SAM protein, partial [Clostridia bacterium]|nr:radical SAM protein [Clostridia bacterium]